MNVTKIMKAHISKPWFISMALLCIFFATVGYKYGWDDQHVEIPLLKSLINNNLYVGDYYVESLKQNFTSFFYILLSKIITVEQIPIAYFLFFCLSRYFLFYWIYKIWLHLSQDKFKAVMCVLVIMYVVRIEEFLYRTFSHQEFALAIIFAGIYYFYKKKYFLASALLGISMNFHALYSLFPFFYMGLYLLWQNKEIGFKKIVKILALFITLSLPFVIWSIRNRMAFAANYTGTYQGWLNLYHYICPQNFFFPPIPFAKLTQNMANFAELNKGYLFLLVLFLLNIFLNADFRRDKKALAITYGAMILLFFCFIFTYLYPHKFVLDLNLTRNTQFLHFILIGYTTLWIIDHIDRSSILLAFSFGTLFAIFKFYKGFVFYPVVGALFCLGVIANLLRFQKSLRRDAFIVLTSLFLGLFLFALQFLYVNAVFKYSIMIVLFIIFILNVCALIVLKAIKNPIVSDQYKRIFLIIPLLLYFSHYSFYNFERQHLEKHDEGFWRLRRNWIDMQKYVKAKTPTDAKILVPYDMMMGGFRIYSERTIIFSERDCGIIGFDYGAAMEWLKRLKQMEDYRTGATKSFYKAIDIGIFEYNADYVVFMRYFMPKENRVLQRLYTNTDFALYKVIRY